MRSFFKVHGSRGWIDVNPSFDYDHPRLRALYFGNGVTRLDEPNPARNPYQFQAKAQHFSHCIQNNIEPKTTGEEDLRDMRYIAEIYRAAGHSV